MINQEAQDDIADFDAVSVASTFVAEIHEREIEIDDARRLPKDLAERMRDAGLFRIMQPKQYHGLEVDLRSYFDAVAVIGKANASAGWNMMITTTGGMMAAYLPDQMATEVFSGPSVVAAGAGAPRGTATKVDGGVRVNGRWSFGSGCQISDWLMAGCFLVEESGTKIVSDSGAPVVIQPWFKAEDVAIDEDSWQVLGLKGTGSHDYEIHDKFVREGFWSSFPGMPRIKSPLYCMSTVSLSAVGMASVGIGIAERAIEIFVELATYKVPTGSTSSLASKASSQKDLGRALAKVKAARSFMYQAIDSVWYESVQNGEVSKTTVADLRLAIADGIWASAEAVDLLYNAAAATAIYDNSGLQRCFRDIHVVTAHILAAQPNYEIIGRVAMGMDENAGGAPL